MSKRINRKKACDIVFIVDYTESTASFNKVFNLRLEDFAFDFIIEYRQHSIKFACICYRDPVDCPSDAHQVMDFDEDIENLAIFLEDKKPSGGGDGPEDFVGALNEALNLSWRDGQKMIFWFANGPAHGKRFCGLPNHQEEEPKLVSLVERIAKEKFYFYGLSIMDDKNDTDSRVIKTFNEMREIFEQICHDSDHFKIKSIYPDSIIMDRFSENNYSSYYDEYNPFESGICEALFE